MSFVDLSKMCHDEARIIGSSLLAIQDLIDSRTYYSYRVGGSSDIRKAFALLRYKLTHEVEFWFDDEYLEKIQPNIYRTVTSYETVSEYLEDIIDHPCVSFGIKCEMNKLFKYVIRDPNLYHNKLRFF